jgi:hypothetical protein
VKAKPALLVVPRTTAAVKQPAKPFVTVVAKKEVGTIQETPARPTNFSNLPPLRSAKKWPPAFDVRPPEDSTEPVVAPKKMPTPVPAPVMKEAPSPRALPNSTARVVRPLVPADLRERVRAVCGKQAKEVNVEVGRDGVWMVTVKVPTLNVGNQLATKILTAVPEMASPKIRLTVDSMPNPSR